MIFCKANCMNSCNKLFVDYEDIIDRFLLIRLRSKIFDIAMCIANDSYIGEE